MNNLEAKDQLDPIRIGVVGAGHLGRFHIECIGRISGFKLVGFYDADPVRAKEIAEKYSVQAFNSFHSLLNEVEAVCIVTPTPSHYALAVSAIESDKHLFIEKPLTDHPDTSQWLAEKMAEKKLVGRVGHVERYNPAFIAARQMGIHKPVFIEAHRLAPFNPRGMDVPVIMDLMIHDIDIVLSMVDAEVDHIEANGVGVAGKSADICNARITFKNDAVANLTASRISLKQMRKLRLFQRDQYMAIDFLEQEVQVVKLFHTEPSDMMTMKLELPDGNRWIAADNPSVTKHNAIEAELSEFCEAIRNNSTSGVTFEQGARAVKVASQIMDQISRHEV
ncbi:MAG: Gfo/Idh/MocA family oxidoreductase [Saprospiraceae bacterium]|nr:Gfo/Idh/MocA family oxidoreductase [Saprospiraceae bacterium]